MKKSNLSITMVISIILVLVVVFVLIWVMKDYFYSANQASTCEQQGGKCIETACEGTVSAFECPKEKICCMEIG